MKSILTIILAFGLLLGNVSLIHGQGERPDPNAKVKAMGLTGEDIEELCSAARGKLQPYYDWGINAVFELIIDLEEKSYPEFESKGEAYQWIGKMWDEKYSCIYCESDNGIEGSLDMMGLYYANKYWVYDLYAPKGACLSNVNAIRIIDDSFDVEGTLIDYIDYVTETRPTTSIEKFEGKKINLQGYRRQLIDDFGAKRMSEMTEEEIKRNRKD